MVIVFSFSNRTIRKSIDNAFELIPTGVEAVLEVHNGHELSTVFRELLDDKSRTASTFTGSLYQILHRTSSSQDSFLILSNSSENLNDGFLILPSTPDYKEWVSSYLAEAKQVHQPYRKVEYRGYDIQVCSFAQGIFFSTVEIDGYLVLSHQISNLYAVIDAFMEPIKSSTPLLAFNKSHSKSAIATLYLKKFTETPSKLSFTWEVSYLMRERNKISLLQRVDENNGMNFSNSAEFADNELRESLKLTPTNAFSVMHYTQAQLRASFDANSTLLSLSPHEKEWYELSYPLIEEGFLNGIYGCRIYDSVVSSNLILKSIDSLSILKTLEQNNSRLFRRLLREETTYYSPYTYAIPSPKWLNELFEVSRDQRVLYIATLPTTGTLLSWDFNLLISYLEESKQPSFMKIHAFEKDLLSPQNYFYMGDL